MLCQNQILAPHIPVPSPCQTINTHLSTAFCPSENDTISFDARVPYKLVDSLELQGCPGQSVPWRCHTSVTKCWRFHVTTQKQLLFLEFSHLLFLAWFVPALLQKSRNYVSFLLSPPFYAKLAHQNNFIPTNLTQIWEGLNLIQFIPTEGMNG